MRIAGILISESLFAYLEKNEIAIIKDTIFDLKQYSSLSKEVESIVEIINESE